VSQQSRFTAQRTVADCTTTQPETAAAALAVVSVGERVVICVLLTAAVVEFSLRLQGAASPIGLAWTIDRLPAALLFGLLIVVYLGLGLESVRRHASSVIGNAAGRQAIAPAVLLAGISLNTSNTTSPGTFIGCYAAYLFTPMAVLATMSPAKRDRPGFAWPLVVALLLWAPIQLGLPKLHLAGVYDATHLIAIVTALYYLLVAAPVDGLGFTFRFTLRDWRAASVSLAMFVAIGAPLGLTTGFLVWQPQLTISNLLLVPSAIYLHIAVPEELLFRGIIQRALTTRLTVGPGLVVSALIFGVVHGRDWRYVALASLAGVAYGWVYQQTRRISASALTHAAVDWIWVVWLHR
jgi:membrane protease YdiL (CAAX protease family)